MSNLLYLWHVCTYCTIPGRAFASIRLGVRTSKGKRRLCCLLRPPPPPLLLFFQVLLEHVGEAGREGRKESFLECRNLSSHRFSRILKEVILGEEIISAPAWTGSHNILSLVQTVKIGRNSDPHSSSDFSYFLLLNLHASGSGPPPLTCLYSDSSIR